MAPTTRTITVAGMTCGHCVAAVEGEIGKIDAVTSVQADLESGLVTVEAEGPLADQDLVAAVDEAGYEVAS
jgi:copper chaperone